MKDLQFANTISSLRKQKSLTQEEVASFVGVSKAAVSKWETGISYPDILLLPKIATYFTLTIDELLGYKPQMTKENIQKLYVELSQEIANKSFDDVYPRIKNLIDEYYSCFPLLMQMAVLLLNYQPVAGDSKDEVMQKVITLCQRVEECAEDPRLTHQARTLEASCQLILQNPQRVLDLLGNDVEPYIGNEIIIANAYQQLQQSKKAEETMQVSMYQYILGIVSIASNYLMMNMNQLEKFDKVIDRTEQVIQAFDLAHLHFNSTLIFYLTSAQGYMMQTREEKAIEMIEKYVKVSQSIKFPITLHGDEFFDLIDGWVDREFDLGSNAPRDEQSIKHSLVSAIQDNPVFKPLLQKNEVRLMLTNLQHKLGCD